MHNCAIICEYNPFHTGHKYQLDRVCERGASAVFCVMSGNFVQSAMPAFCDKSIRAECAVRGGANAVIELPTIYATASAGYFAEGAVKIISQIKGISHIAMGATSPSDFILKLAEIKIKHSDKYNELLKNYLKTGKSYNYACVSALNELYSLIYADSTDITPIIQEPNNMLCIEYITAIDKYAANIEPFIVKRSGAQHNSSITDGNYVSATAIRNAIDNDGADSIKRYIPYCCDRIIEYRTYHSPDINAYKKAALFALKRASVEEISRLRNCSDGMEYLLKRLSPSSYDELVESTELKKFGKKRVERLLLDCLLDIKKENLSSQFITRLLACKNDFDFKILPEIVKITNSDIRDASVSSSIKTVLNIDENATALYNTLSGISGGYYNYSLVKV